MKEMKRSKNAGGLTKGERDHEIGGSSGELVEEIERNLENVKRRLDMDYDADIQAIAKEIHEIASVLVETQIKLLKLMTREHPTD